MQLDSLLKIAEKPADNATGMTTQRSSSGTLSKCPAITSALKAIRAMDPPLLTME